MLGMDFENDCDYVNDIFLIYVPFAYPGTLFVVFIIKYWVSCLYLLTIPVISWNIMSQIRLLHCGDYIPYQQCHLNIELYNLKIITNKIGILCVR